MNRAMPRADLAAPRRSSRPLLLTGALLALAWALHFILPGRQSAWAFAAACLIGLAPVARRALRISRDRPPDTWRPSR
mgnify:CR=1 FL=1